MTKRTVKGIIQRNPASEKDEEKLHKIYFVRIINACDSSHKKAIVNNNLDGFVKLCVVLKSASDAKQSFRR